MPRPIRSGYVIPAGAQFGAQRAGGARRHNGTDYHAPPGTAIYGTGEGGVVTHIGYNGDARLGLGHNITIRYPDRTSLDAHLQSRSPLKVGDPVGPNTLVGRVGRTGNAVNADPQGPWNGNHLHQEIRKLNGLLINPEAYYGASPAGDGSTPIGFLMALSDKQQQQLYDAVESIFAATFSGGPSMPDANLSIGQSLQQIRAGVATLQQYTYFGGEGVAGTIGDPGSIFGRLLGLQAQVSGLSEAIKTLAVGQGLDPEAIEQAAHDGAAKALANLDVPTAAENGQAAREAIVK